MGNVELSVWVEAWQMQCCGERFALGDEVSWTLREPGSEWLTAVLGADLAGRVAAAEEHHGGLPGSAPVTVGTVASIQTVHCRYAPVPDGPALYPVAGSGVVSSVTSADGWTPDRDDLRFVGYLVQLTGARTRPPE